MKSEKCRMPSGSWRVKSQPARIPSSELAADDPDTVAKAIQTCETLWSPQLKERDDCDREIDLG
jgi:hypothetical protein